MKLTLLSEDELRRALPMTEAIAAMSRAFAALSAGSAEMPQRLALRQADLGAVTLVKPAFLPATEEDKETKRSAALGVKIVSVFPQNRERELASIHGLVVMLDAQTGIPEALIDGTFLTAWRTGAASGSATDLLARPDATTGAVIGTGPQARTQIVAIDAVRDLERIRVTSRRPENVERFVESMAPEIGATIEAVESPERAVVDADVLCVATDSTVPVFDGSWLKPGAHVNAVGSFTPEMREFDTTTVARASIFVDHRPAAGAEAGELIAGEREAATSRDQWIELGKVIAGMAPGRQSSEEITLFKSVGVAVQDVEAGAAAVENAGRLGIGKTIEL